MKLFVLPEQGEEDRGQFDGLTGEVTALMLKMCERLLRRPKLELLHTALFLLHCQAKVISYHSFDRFIYSCAAILVASKLTENMEFNGGHILKALRALLRERKGMAEVGEQDQEEQAKLKQLGRRLFEAEVNIMINIGFDFDIELALFWLQEWTRAVSDPHIIKKTEEALTSVYQTNTVIYFEPQLIALTALSIVMKSEGISLELCSWDRSLMAKLTDHAEGIKQVKDMFMKRKSYAYR